MRKALLLTLLLAFVSALCLPGRASADAILSVQSPGPVDAGSTFLVTVNISNAANVYGFQFNLGYDATLVQAIGVSEGGFLPSGGGTTFFVPGTIDNGLGSFYSNGDVLIGNIPGVDGMGTLLQFDFKAIAAGTSALTLTNIFLLDPNFNLLNESSVDGSVTVNRVVSTPESSVIVYLAAFLLLCLLSRQVRRIA
jgi:hypothetical protein